MAIIRTEALTKYYGRILGIEGLDLSIEPGETFGLLGANGSGKTTTIRLLLDLLKPTRGRAIVDGLESRRDSVRVRARIGYLPADMPVYPEMSGRTYLAFLARLQATPPTGALMQSLFERFALRPVDLDRRIRDLSHGTKRKLGIIQALMQDTPIVILDEPTSGLDPLMIEAFAETLTELRARGRTVLLSSHVLSEVEKLCDRVAIVARGRLARVASLAELREGLPRRARVVFREPVPGPPRIDGTTLISALPREWQFEVEGPTGPLVRSVAALPVEDLEVTPGSLEAHILQLFRGAPEA